MCRREDALPGNSVLDVPAAVVADNDSAPVSGGALKPYAHDGSAQREIVELRSRSCTMTITAGSLPTVSRSRLQRRTRAILRRPREDTVLARRRDPPLTSPRPD
jgi:hypothetical protein